MAVSFWQCIASSGDHCTLDLHQRKKLRYCGDLIAFIIDGQLPNHQPCLGGESSHRMQRVLVGGTIKRSHEEPFRRWRRLCLEANRSTSAQLLPPQIVAVSVTKTISSKSWLWPRSTRGSVTLTKLLKTRGGWSVHRLAPSYGKHATQLRAA